MVARMITFDYFSECEIITIFFHYKHSSTYFPGQDFINILCSVLAKVVKGLNAKEYIWLVRIKSQTNIFLYCLTQNIFKK